MVKNITDYGAFIDLGGIDGLLHITDMSWGRVGHPSELFKVNDEIDVVVLKYDAGTERVSLGHKQLIQDPWVTAMDRYPVGARMSGKVVSLTDYGAFIELEPGVEGLIHVSEMSWSKRVKHPSKILNVGDTVEAMVLGVDPAARRISLGLKQVESNPWHELVEKYPVGTRIKGKVRNLTEFGAFVEVEEDIDGLIHISDMSWSKRIKHPSEVLKKGDVVEAMVLSIDAENQRLSLGLKQLATDIWEDFFSRHKVGDTIEGKIVRMTNFGAFVELDEGIEGLIHVSEFDDSQGGEKINLEVGQTTPMKIIKLSPADRKIGLSIRALKSDEVRTDWAEYSSAQGEGGATLGEHFKFQEIAIRRQVRARRLLEPLLLADREPHDSNDESRARRRGLTGVRPHEEALRGHRRHGVPEHHRCAAPRREDRASRLWQLSAPQARAPQGPQPQDRRQGGRAAQARALLQARQRAEGPHQQGRRSTVERRGLVGTRVGRFVSSSTARTASPNRAQPAAASFSTNCWSESL